jgi:flagellar basal-body rod modification protein FlgD
MASSTDSVGATSSQSTTASASASATSTFGNVNLDDFIKMLVAELQNQDPMEPMKNSDLLQEVSQIRAIQSNDQLNTTLQSVSLGQNLTNASILLGGTITGLNDSGDKITGMVDRVTLDNGVATLHIGDNTVSLNNVSEVLPAGTTGG